FVGRSVVSRTAIVSQCSSPLMSYAALPASWRRTRSMPSEDEQLSITRALAITDPSPDAELDQLVRYVARVCNAPSAVLGLFGRTRLWFKSRLGVEASETP